MEENKDFPTPESPPPVGNFGTPNPTPAGTFDQPMQPPVPQYGSPMNQIQPVQQQGYYNPNVPRQAIDPNVAWLELIGLLGFLGIGYLVAGRTNDGIIRLVGYLLFMFVGWTVIAILSLVIIGLCLIPFMLAAQVGIPIWSALTLKSEIERGVIR